MILINDIKQRAKCKLEGKYFKYFTMCLGLFILSLVLELFKPDKSFNLGFELISMLFSCTISMYLYIADLNIENEKHNFKPTMNELLSVALKGIVIMALTSFMIIVGFIFFIIPGIIISVLLSQAPYILIEDNSKSVVQCLMESKDMMKGNVMNYLLLQLSFLGSLILGVLTLGIGFYWTAPRIQISNVIFYKDIKSQYNEKNFSY